MTAIVLIVAGFIALWLAVKLLKLALKVAMFGAVCIAAAVGAVNPSLVTQFF